MQSRNYFKDGPTKKDGSKVSPANGETNSLPNEEDKEIDEVEAGELAFIDEFKRMQKQT